MKTFKSLAAERFRTTFLVFYALSSLIPTLIIVFLVLYYAFPVLMPSQIEKITQTATIGLGIMVGIPCLGFFLMNWWIKSLERLTEEMKNKTAKVLSERVVISDKNEIVTLHRHFDGLFGELQGKIQQVDEVSKELMESKKKLSRMAITDQLTGLFNRRYFNRRLLEEIQKAIKRKIMLALIMIDVDGFKKYNESHGHQAGDSLLHALGLLIKDYTHEPDVPFRYGGDEFAIILPGASIEEAAAKAQKLVDAASRLAVKGLDKGQPAKASISCGVISYAQKLENLIMEADRCLNQAVAATKGSVICLSPRGTGPA